MGGRECRPNAVRSVHNDQGQDSPTQTNYARLIRRLLYGANKNNSFLVTGLY